MTAAARLPARRGALRISGAPLPSLLLALALARHDRRVRWTPSARTEPEIGTPLVLTPRVGPAAAALPPAGQRAIAGRAARQIDAFARWIAALLDLPLEALPLQRLPWRFVHAAAPVAGAAAILDGGWVWRRAQARLHATPAVVVDLDAPDDSADRRPRITVLAAPWDGAADAADAAALLPDLSALTVITLSSPLRTLFPWESRVLIAPTAAPTRAAAVPRSSRLLRVRAAVRPPHYALLLPDMSALPAVMAAELDVLRWIAAMQRRAP